MPTVWCTTHTSATNPLSAAPVIRSRRVDGRSNTASAQAACAAAMTRKNVPIRRDSARCSGTTVKWIAAAAPESAASTGAATLPSGFISRRGGSPPVLRSSNTTAAIGTGYASPGQRRSAPLGARSTDCRAQRAGADRSGAESGDEDSVRVGQDRPSVALPHRPQVRLHGMARLRHAGDRVEIFLVDAAIA